MYCSSQQNLDVILFFFSFSLSLLVMIFVNYAGTSSYYFFAHVTWDGLYIADLVFPWFVWIMGTSMIFSMRGMRKRNTPNKVIMWRICKRSFWLFAALLGSFLILWILLTPLFHAFQELLKASFLTE